jgi:hypothetical protein
MTARSALSGGIHAHPTLAHAIAGQYQIRITAQPHERRYEDRRQNRPSRQRAGQDDVDQRNHDADPDQPEEDDRRMRDLLADPFKPGQRSARPGGFLRRCRFRSRRLAQGRGFLRLSVPASRHFQKSTDAIQPVYSSNTAWPRDAPPGLRHQSVVHAFPPNTRLTDTLTPITRGRGSALSRSCLLPTEGVFP